MDAKSSGERFGLAVWDAIAEILNREIHDLPDPDRDELERAANALRDSANAFLFSEKKGRPWPLYPYARDMAFAVLDWWNNPTDGNFATLRKASKRFDEERINHDLR
jgi:phage terminase large subunit-like protein